MSTEVYLTTPEKQLESERDFWKGKYEEVTKEREWYTTRWLEIDAEIAAKARAAALWEALEALSVLSDECTPEEFAVLVKADRAIRRLRSRGKGGEG